MLSVSLSQKKQAAAGPYGGGGGGYGGGGGGYGGGGGGYGERSTRGGFVFGARGIKACGSVAPLDSVRCECATDACAVRPVVQAAVAVAATEVRASRAIVGLQNYSWTHFVHDSPDLDVTWRAASRGKHCGRSAGVQGVERVSHRPRQSGAHNLLTRAARGQSLRAARR